MFNSKVNSLDEYLGQIARQLRDLPAAARADELREIEVHLRALVLAGQQIEDISEAEATTAALRQFGAPTQVGRKLRRAWERKQPEAWWRAGLAPIFYLAFVGFIATPLLDKFQVFYFLHFYGINIYDTSIYVDWMADAEFKGYRVSLNLFSFILMSMATFVMGLISPKRGKFGIAAILFFTFLPVVADGGFTTPHSPLSVIVNFVVSAMLGTYLGARRGRKREVPLPVETR